MQRFRIDGQGRSSKGRLGFVMVVAGLLGLVGTGAIVVAAPSAAVAAEAPWGDGFLDGMLVMMQDHMGLDTDDAAEWADEMFEHMTAIHGEDAETMARYCLDAYEGGAGPEGNSTVPSTGMMNGYDGGMMGGYDGGMMGDGYGAGMMGGSSSGMMGSGMMGF